ncbi:MAG: hypothetical protein JEY99_08855 [Spirochaetales bacterium]|nr:hypothetical protein [Spirochaetales bacterium]
MKREDFVFSVGYQGESALVDSRAKSNYKNLDTRQLAEKGLFRAALCSALYSGKPEDEKAVVEEYNRISGADFNSIDQMKRLVGVYRVPEEISRIISL